jgi:flagellar biosynthesis protein FlhG
MALNGARVVLIDADLQRAAVARLCGLTEPVIPFDILSARRDIHEVIQLGPAGVQIVPGLSRPKATTGLSSTQHKRLITQLHALHRHADIVLIDAGSEPNEIAQRFWDVSDEVVITSLPNSLIVMDTYAAIKAMSHGNTTGIRFIVNQATGNSEAHDIHQRVRQSCRRFLEREIEPLGIVTKDSVVPLAETEGRPLLIHAPENVVSQQIREIASKLCDVTDRLTTGFPVRAA